MTVTASPVAPATSDDFTLSADTVLSFAANETESTGTVTIRVVDEEDPEPHDVVTVSGAVSDAAVTAPDDVTLTIVNDDFNVRYEVAVEAPATVAEDAGTASVTVTLTTRENVAPAVETQMLYFARPAQTAEVGEDYTSPVTEAPTIVTIVAASDFSPNAAGTAWVTEVSFTIGIVDDDLDEADETIVFFVGAQTDDSSDQTITINDDDDEPALSVDDERATEGEAVAFTVRLTAASGRTVAVDVATAIGGAQPAQAVDFAGLAATTLMFLPGDTEKTVPVATVEDELDEPDETFLLVLTNAAHATLPADPAAGTIGDDDEPPVVRVDDGRADEGEAVAFVVRLSAASGRTVTVDWAAAAEGGDTAEAGTDFTAVAATALTFAAGQTRRTVRVATAEDELDEANETFTVRLTDPSHATLAADPTAAGRIVDDDGAPVLSVEQAAPAEEGDGVEFTVSLSAESAQQVTVEWAATGGTAGADDFVDLAAAAGKLTIAAGLTAGTVTVATAEDELDEAEETFTLTLSSPVNATLPADPTVTGTISDDDEPPAVSYAAAAYAVDEGDEVEVTVELSEPSGRREVVVPISAAGGDGATTADYAVGRLESVTFPAGVTERSFTLEAAPDPFADAGESVLLSFGTLPEGARAGSVPEATVSLNDVPVTVSFGQAAYTAAEGGAAVTVRLYLSMSLWFPVSGTVERAHGAGATAADYTGFGTGAWRFPLGTTDFPTIEVSAVDDADYEGDETVTLSLAFDASYYTGLSVGTPSEATLTIEDDDLPVVTIAADAIVTTEEQDAEFTLSRTGLTAAALTVRVAVRQQAERDLLPDGAATERMVTFAADAATAALTVELEKDTLRELPGELTVEVQAGTGYTVGDPTRAVVDVRDGDRGAPLTPQGLTAEAGSRAGAVVLAWTAPAPHLVYDRHEYRSKTDGAYGDWRSIPNSGRTPTVEGANLAGYTVTGLAGGQEHTFQVRARISYGSAPSVNVYSDASNEATATPRSAPALPELSVADAEATEGSAVPFIVRLSAASTQTVTVDWATSVETGDTAISGTDFTAVQATTLTFDAGETEKTVTVMTTEDTIDEDDQTFTVTLSNASPSSLAELATDPTATGTIEDDDPTPTVDVADATATEGDNLEFAVTLSAKSEKTVTAAWVSSVESGDTASTADFASGFFFTDDLRSRGAGEDGDCGNGRRRARRGRGDLHGGSRGTEQRQGGRYHGDRHHHRRRPDADGDRRRRDRERGRRRGVRGDALGGERPGRGGGLRDVGGEPRIGRLGHGLHGGEGHADHRGGPEDRDDRGRDQDGPHGRECRDLHADDLGPGERDADHGHHRHGHDRQPEPAGAERRGRGGGRGRCGRVHGGALGGGRGGRDVHLDGVDRDRRHGGDGRLHRPLGGDGDADDRRGR